MTDTAPLTILWFRRDLRLSDHAAFTAAAERGPVLPAFVLDPIFESLGAAAKMRLLLSLRALSRDLEARGMRLVLRRGAALPVLQELVAETGADAVYWSRAYDAPSVSRDTEVKNALKEACLQAQSFTGALLFEPWSVETGQGGPYRVYTPFWKAVRHRDVGPCLAVPEVSGPTTWPTSDDLEAWVLGDQMHCGFEVVAGQVQAGEAEAQAKLACFLDTRVDAYKAKRDYLNEAATSDLSDALTYGEISPSQMWHGGRLRMQDGAAGAEHFLKEIVWREFAWHLLWHYPAMDLENWREDWEQFHWHENASDPFFVAWCQGRTGVQVVDAAMRELYVTGKMHNRARMIVASYLTKHLRMHWRLGLQWFADCLVDWDPASNAMGWQWVAGCGPDAAPYFRIFNPDTQAEKFDADGAYRSYWLDPDSDGAQAFMQAIPRSWLSVFETPVQAPIVDIKAGRDAALKAYETFKTQ